MNISDRFASELLAHSIDLGRFDAHERTVTLRLFRALERELLDQLRRVDPAEPSLTVYQQQRAETLLASIRPIIAEQYRQMFTTSRRDLRDLALTEAALTQDLGAELIVDRIFSVLPSDATLKEMVNDLVIEGRPLRQWWSRQASTTFQRYADTIRAGILRGDSTPAMVRSLRGTRGQRYEDGVLSRSARDVQTLVRTSVNSVSSSARFEVFKANEDVLKGWEWLTALDAVVCPICRPYSGQAWAMDGRRLPGTTLPYPGLPPLHPNCRCTPLPVVRAYRELSKAKGPRFESSVKALPQAVKDQLDGGLGVDLSLPVWLRQQSEAEQRRLLGPTRWQLWQQGKLPLHAMINRVTRRPLSIAELKARRLKKAS